MIQEKHEFALYIANASLIVEHKAIGAECIISDEDIYRRMVNVLRLVEGEEVIFFDRQIHVQFKIVCYKEKKRIVGIIVDKKDNVHLMPHITFLLPILKRDDFEQALYNLTAVGVTTIQCIDTEKTKAQRLNKKDYERFQRIIIAASEQSKNFAFPELKEAIVLHSAIGAYAEKKIFFDPQGQSVMHVMQDMVKSHMQELFLLVGPEGDLTYEEKVAVRKAGFIFCALTPTILRSVHASFLGAGIIRSVLSLPSY